MQRSPRREFGPDGIWTCKLRIQTSALYPWTTTIITTFSFYWMMHEWLARAYPRLLAQYRTRDLLNTKQYPKPETAQPLLKQFNIPFKLYQMSTHNSFPNDGCSPDPPPPPPDVVVKEDTSSLLDNTVNNLRVVWALYGSQYSEKWLCYIKTAFRSL